MPVLQFKGKTAVQDYHHVVPHHTLVPDEKLSLFRFQVLDQGKSHYEWEADLKKLLSAS